MSLGEICLRTNMELQGKLTQLEEQAIQAIAKEEACRTENVAIERVNRKWYDDLEAMKASLASAYTERAVLLGLLASMYPSHMFEPDDAQIGFSNALCIHFPWGQGTWHIADHDLRYFGPLETTDGDYDGHSTQDKLDAIALATSDEAYWPWNDQPWPWDAEL
jgi:hypothetical protein